MKKEYKNPLTEIVLSSPMVLQQTSLDDTPQHGMMGGAPKRHINILYI